MRALENLTRPVVDKGYSPLILNNNDIDIKLIKFQRKDRYHLLQLGITDIKEENYRIFLKSHYLTLIISTSREISKPIHVGNINWNLLEQQEYEVMKSVDIWLPGENYYMVKHYLIQEEQILNIFLSRMSYN